jgi:hypothetical protein
MEIQKLHAKRLVANILETQNRPSTTEIHDLMINLDILVWRKGNTSQPGN